MATLGRNTKTIHSPHQLLFPVENSSMTLFFQSVMIDSVFIDQVIFDKTLCFIKQIHHSNFIH